jgi:hypothetical protein
MRVSRQRHILVAPYTGEGNLVHKGRRLGKSQKLEAKPFAHAVDRTSVVQSVGRHYAYWATPVYKKKSEILLKIQNIRLIYISTAGFCSWGHF